MDGMIVKSLTMDIESLKQELTKNTKKIKQVKVNNLSSISI